MKEDYYVELADRHLQLMLQANDADPYEHSTYQAHQSLAAAAVLLHVKGDQPYADALMAAYHETNISIGVLLTMWQRDELCYEYDTDKSKEFQARLDALYAD
jgi:hypothetical protein